MAIFEESVFKRRRVSPAFFVIDSFSDQGVSLLASLVRGAAKLKIRKLIENGKLRAEKLKLDKKFKPLPVDEGDELFPNGIFVFNVTKLTAFIKASADKFPIERVEVGAFPSYAPERLNEDVIQAANLSDPVILAEISPERYNVIDGHHRLEKARRDGLKKIAAHRVPATQHFAFLTSVRAYETYVEYWNSKIEEAA